MLDIFVDTREKKPLDFKQPYINSISTTKLPYGDYACKHNNEKFPFIFERKSIADLFGTLGGSYDRFKKEMNRATSDGVTLVIIVEKPLSKVIDGYERSKIQGIAVARTLFTLTLKYKIPFICCSNRDEMSTWIAESFYSYYKILRGKDGR